MALSKLDLAVALAVAAGLIWIEHGHRIMVGTLASVTAAAPPSICPTTDDVPTSIACLKSMEEGVLPAFRPRIGTPLVSVDADGRADVHVPACDRTGTNAPYSARCLRLLSDDMVRLPPFNTTRRNVATAAARPRARKWATKPPRATGRRRRAETAGR